jgi:hypothetical protein
MGRLALDTTAQVATPAADDDGIVVTCGLTPAGATPEVITWETEAGGTASVSCGVASNEPGGSTLPPVPFLVVDEVALPSPASLTLSHATWGPGEGESWPADVEVPVLNLIAVEAGTLTVRVAAAVEVARAGGRQETVAAGTEIVLGPGDLAFLPPGAGGELRNDGTEPAGALLTTISPPFSPVEVVAEVLEECTVVEGVEECTVVSDAGTTGTPAATAP